MPEVGMGYFAKGLLAGAMVWFGAKDADGRINGLGTLLTALALAGVFI